MLQKTLTKVIAFSALYFLGANFCFAQDAFSPFTTASPASINSDAVNDFSLDLKQNQENETPELDGNASFYHLINATDKFMQCNIRASWEDFRTLINSSGQNDFMYISFANKMADLGLFDLANLAISKIKDKDIATLSTEEMERFYYPRRKLKLEDELFLAEIYSNILYNNQSSEATNELLKNDSLLSVSDYANYLVALGSYKSNVYPQAKKYINLALIQNPTNLNYQVLKAEIFADSDDPAEAIKTVEGLKKQNLYSYEYGRKVKSLEQLVLYKIKKTQWEKDYHLGYYYYLEKDDSKAIRSLQSALSSKKKANLGLTYALMSEVYLDMNEFEKAADTAKKAYKINQNNPKALVTLGDLDYKDKNYKQALNYYKKASVKDKKSYTPFVKEAQTYQKLSNDKKASEIYTKILKTHFDSWDAYYNVALLDKSKTDIYLKKSLAVNPMFEEGWIELARTQIEKDNYDIAQEYLANAFYIDENDFRYYYYQGLVDNNSGNTLKAVSNFKKCLKLNPDYKDAQTALEAIQNNKNDINKQESI